MYTPSALIKKKRKSFKNVDYKALFRLMGAERNRTK